MIGTNNVAVPTHFFKVIVCEADSGDFALESYVMPNQVIDDNIPLSSFQVSFQKLLIMLKYFITANFRFP